MVIDKEAVIFKALPNGNRMVRIKKSKYGGSMPGKNVTWKTTRSYLDGDYIVLIQKKLGD